jgi:hypothetical protein
MSIQSSWASWLILNGPYLAGSLEGAVHADALHDSMMWFRFSAADFLAPAQRSRDSDAVVQCLKALQGCLHCWRSYLFQVLLRMQQNIYFSVAHLHNDETMYTKRYVSVQTSARKYHIIILLKQEWSIIKFLSHGEPKARLFGTPQHMKRSVVSEWIALFYKPWFSYNFTCIIAASCQSVSFLLWGCEPNMSSSFCLCLVQSFMLL